MTCCIISRENNFKNDNEPVCVETKTKLREIIWELYCSGYAEFWVNCEYGIPLWAAEIVIALKIYNDIKLHIAMPYEEQATKWAEEYRDRFFTVHEKADTVTIISKRYTEDCYEKADRYMCDRVNRCIIL